MLSTPAPATRPAPLAVLAGVFTYNAVAVVVRVFAGAMSSMVGVLLWPAVGYHLVLAAWDAACLRRRAPQGSECARAAPSSLRRPGSNLLRHDARQYMMRSSR